jgi:hypothetical protein
MAYFNLPTRRKLHCTVIFAIAHVGLAETDALIVSVLIGAGKFYSGTAARLERTNEQKNN